MPLATLSLGRAVFGVTPHERQPEIHIDEESLEAIKEPSELKFGYHDDARRQIYWELVQANYECADQSEREFPEPPVLNYPGRQADLNDYISNATARFDKLWEQRQDEIAKEYKLHREQLDHIDSEGTRKHWPQPVDPLRHSSDKQESTKRASPSSDPWMDTRD